MSTSSSVTPAVPPAGPGFLALLFRPNRWRLWVQFALFGTFVLVIPILLTSYQLLQSGRQVLIDHEVIDLADESNLRVNDFREDMAYLARDVRRLAAEAGATPAGVRAGLKLDARPPGLTDPATVRDARRKYLYGTVAGVYRFPAGNPAAAALPPDTPARTAALAAVLSELDERMRRPASPTDRSGLHLQPAGGGQPSRCLLAIGGPSADGAAAFAVVIDFAGYVGQRQAVSPRHFYLVTDPAGGLLIRPRQVDADDRASIREVAPWTYPADDGVSWFDPLPTPEARKRRLAKAVASGGGRLAYGDTTLPEFAFRYRKGYFGKNLDLTRTIANAKAASDELNARLAREMAADPILRCGEGSAQFGYVELSHPDEKRLQAVSGVIDAWWKQHGDGSAVRWTHAIRCERFQGQLVPMRVDLNDVDEPGWMIVAAAVEELREDIDDRFDRIHTRWVLPTLAVSLALGVGLVLTLTYSLRRLAKAARKLSRGEDVRLPLGGSREVSTLAATLDEMVRRVGARDRELSERAARYQTILRAAGEGVVVTDALGRIEEANKAAGRMFGVPAETLIGRTVSSLLDDPGALPNPAESTREELVTSQAAQSFRGRRLDNGGTFWLEVNLRPVTLPDRVIVVCVLRDVTRRKEDAERIQRMNEELESRVRVRTAELEQANGKLEIAVRDAQAAVRAKDSFVANMSHELRQPLHIIIGFTEALKEEATDDGLEAAVRDLDKILSAAKHLLDLINDILDMAKISAGKMELCVAAFPLAKLVADVATLVGPLAGANGNRFEVTAPADLGVMTSDERRVKQILLNLLSNAFKFTSGGTVRFAAERYSEGGREWVRFRVSDSGMGMTAEQVGRLFQRFYQADSSTTRGQGGTGLGLAITQSFNELLGGQPIHVTSAVGKGSEFVVALPAVVGAASHSPPPPTDEPGTPPDGTESAAGRTVLVIDDDPAVRELMRRFLSKEGFAVVEAATGEEGLAIARETRPCLVTLDVMMPGSDGWSVLAQLKADPATADIPVVMLTIVDDRGRGYSLGAADYLTKPIDWNRLGTILRKYLAPGRDTVLVVDDDADNRTVIRRYLDREGWKIAEAENGEEALRRFAETPPAVILLDLMMPVLDGFGFLDELTKRFPGHRVPVVILTAKELTPDDFDRLNGRVSRILEKGDLTSLENLLAMIRRTAKPAA